MFNSISKAPYLDADDAIGGGSDDFSDVVLDAPAEETTETEEETTDTPAEVEDTTTTEVETKAEAKFKLKYNHEEKDYTEDETKTLAQKGLNYDRTLEKLTELQANPALAKYGRVEEISKLLGYQTDDELLDALYQTHYERAAEANGLTPAQMKKDHELQQRENKFNQDTTAAEATTKNNKMYADFNNNFPDIKAEKISQDTWNKVNEGMDLSAAYGLQQNKELMAELKTYKQNAENSKKAPVNGVSGHGSDMKAEKIFEGFDD